MQSWAGLGYEASQRRSSASSGESNRYYFSQLTSKAGISVFW